MKNMEHENKMVVRGLILNINNFGELHYKVVILNINNFENGPTLPKTQVVEGVETMMPIISVEDKAQRRLEMMKAIEKRFGGNAATKKIQRNLLKQQYENFTASNSEMLDQIFDRLQKLVSQLELLGEKILQEDVNQKLLKSLSPERNTHTMVWRNKSDLDTMSIDDLYNNLKVFEPEVKGMSSSNSRTQNMAFVSSSNNNSSNVAVNAAQVVNTAQVVNIANGVSTGDTQFNIANIDNLSDIHPDDLKKMDLKWQMDMLTMRARRFMKNTERKLNLNGNKTVAFDKTKVECFNCHKRGHFARECRAPGAQNKRINESTRRIVHVETTNSSALVSCDGLGEDIKKLKFEIRCNEITIRELRKKLETAQREKDGIQLTVEKLKNASKSLNKLIYSQIVDNCKKGLGYNAVPPPHTGLFMPPKPDLSYISLEELTSEPAVETLNAKTSEDVPKVVKNDNGAPIFED
nr:hypothetical protein [Tanacetum cinerariifolium]